MADSVPVSTYLRTVITIDRAKQTSAILDHYSVAEIVTGLNKVELPALPRHANSETLKISAMDARAGTVTAWSHGRMASDAEREIEERLKKLRGESDYTDVLSALAKEFSGAWVTAKKLRGKYKKIEDLYEGKIASADGNVLVLLGEDNAMIVLPMEDIVALTVSLGDDTGKLSCTFSAKAARATPEVVVEYTVTNIEFELWYDAVISKMARAQNPSDCTLRLAGISRIDNKSGGLYENADVSAVFSAEKPKPAFDVYAPEMQMQKRSRAPGQTMAAPPPAAPFGGGDAVMLQLGQGVALIDGRTTGTTAFDKEINASKYYQFDGRFGSEDAQIVVVWRNDEKTGIGRALPAAKVRPSEKDSLGRESTMPEFDVRETIEPNELVEWSFGATDKVTIKRDVSNTTVKNRGSGAELIKSGTDETARFSAKIYSLDITNMMPDDVTARIVVGIGHTAWKIVKGSSDSWKELITPWHHPEKKTSTGAKDYETALFDVAVAGENNLILGFTVVDTRSVVSGW